MKNDENLEFVPFVSDNKNFEEYAKHKFVVLKLKSGEMVHAVVEFDEGVDKENGKRIKYYTNNQIEMRESKCPNNNYSNFRIYKLEDISEIAFRF